jgi:hypothetical protein
MVKILMEFFFSFDRKRSLAFPLEYSNVETDAPKMSERNLEFGITPRHPPLPLRRRGGEGR